MDKYCALFGIELVPCIQTLAHLHSFLRWHNSMSLRDTGDILKVGSEEVYTFIRSLLESLRSCFSTRNIHIGMDESHMLGLGNYLRENGYEESSVIIRRHTDRVLELCQETGWTPMMWSDMYITANTGGGYYDVKASTDTSGWEKPLKNWEWYTGIITIPERIFTTICSGSTKLCQTGDLCRRDLELERESHQTMEKPSAAADWPLKPAARKAYRKSLPPAGWTTARKLPLMPFIRAGRILFLCFHEDLYEEELSTYFRDCIDAELEDFFCWIFWMLCLKAQGKISQQTILPNICCIRIPCWEFLTII